MGRQASKWRQMVEPHFGFLAEHGFRVTGADDSTWWETSLTYTSPVAGIKVARSQEFDRSEVNLIRLVDGTIPPYPIWVTADRRDWALLDMALKARSPEKHAEAMRMTGLSKRELEKQLVFWAESIRTILPDFLAGDLSVIDEAAELVREVVISHPQQITAWVPEDAPVGAEEAEAAALAKTVPQEVSVSVRRYRRGKPAK